MYVKDHCSAIRTILNKGRIGEVYNVGGWNEKTNLEVVGTLCKILDDLQPKIDKSKYSDQITFIKDRPGHDRRYAIDASKLKCELNWQPEESFDTGIFKTVEWYINHQDWVNNVMSGAYKSWVQKHYS